MKMMTDYDRVGFLLSKKKLFVLGNLFNLQLYFVKSELVYVYRYLENCNSKIIFMNYTHFRSVDIG